MVNAPSPHHQARAWVAARLKSTRSCPHAEFVLPRHPLQSWLTSPTASTCKLWRHAWYTREDMEHSTSLSSLPPSPRLFGSSTHGRITVAGDTLPPCLRVPSLHELGPDLPFRLPSRLAYPTSPVFFVVESYLTLGAPVGMGRLG